MNSLTITKDANKQEAEKSFLQMWESTKAAVLAAIKDGRTVFIKHEAGMSRVVEDVRVVDHITNGGLRISIDVDPAYKMVVDRRDVKCPT